MVGYEERNTSNASGKIRAMTAEEFVRDVHPNVEIIETLDSASGGLFWLYEMFIPYPGRNDGVKKILGYGLSHAKAWENCRYNMLDGMQKAMER